MPISVRDLLEAGAHFGHRTHRWNPKMRPYIYGARNGIHIIDLEKTAKLWAKAEKTIIDTVSRGQKVLFVGTKPQAQEIIAEEATRANQHFVNRRWLGGMLTNFKTIKTRIDRLRDLENLKTSDQIQRITKKEAGELEKLREKLARALNGITTMASVPGLVVVVDPGKEHIALSEAMKLQIPLVAIIDTNCDPDGIEFPVPANDDALKSVRLFLQTAADACLEGARVFEQKIQEETRRRMEADAKRAAAKAAVIAAPVIETTPEPLAVAQE
ncbi:MAG: 30S ribosomal protein S2 [Pseudomonadota bacterium]